MWRQAKLPVLMLFADIAMVLAGMNLSCILRPQLPFGKLLLHPMWWAAPLWILIPAIWILCHILTHGYDLRRQVRGGDVFWNLVTGAGLATLLLSGLLFFSYREMSRLQVLVLSAVTTVLLLGNRLVIRGLLKTKSLSSITSRRVLILGSNEISEQLVQTFTELGWMGFELVDVVEELPLPEMFEKINRDKIDEVLITRSFPSAEMLRKLVYELHEKTGANVRIVPDVYPLAFLRVFVDEFGGVPLITLREPVLTPFERLTKRTFDLLLGTVLLILFAPLMGVIWLWIKLDSAGPAIFVQERVGESGRLFRMFKFRTMKADASASESPVPKSALDPRITRVGRILRSFSLDEILQLWNVIKGEMSLVGPRPEMPWLVDKYESWQRKRFSVPQGITGWWQVNGRSEKPMHQSTEEDLFYIQHYSLWLDLVILAKTVKVVLQRKGAF